MNKVVGPSTAATAVVVDLRGFTRELNRARVLDSERVGGVESAGERFCSFLAEMNAAIVTAATVSLPPAQRPLAHETVHVGSTGDGAILAFLHPEIHGQSGFLAALLLEALLDRACAAYNAEVDPPKPLSFGIGAEVGRVRRVGAAGSLSLNTVIGGCINAAARVQDLTKDIDRTRVLVCGGLVAHLTTALLGEDYGALMAATTVPAGSVDDAAFFELERRMVALNRRLCLNFLHNHRLRGFDRPLALFRVSKSSAVVGTPRFDTLIEALVQGDTPWAEELRWHFTGSG